MSLERRIDIVGGVRFGRLHARTDVDLVDGALRRRHGRYAANCCCGCGKNNREHKSTARWTHHNPAPGPGMDDVKLAVSSQAAGRPVPVMAGQKKLIIKGDRTTAQTL